jgi:hypothetical protein
MMAMTSEDVNRLNLSSDHHQRPLLVSVSTYMGMCYHYVAKCWWGVVAAAAVGVMMGQQQWGLQ